jgi:hypothetical protein
VPVPLHPVKPVTIITITQTYSGQLSVTIGLPVEIKLVSIVQIDVLYTVSLAGQVIDGLMVSRTKIAWIHVVILPQLSMTVKVLVITPVPLHPVKPRYDYHYNSSITPDNYP